MNEITPIYERSRIIAITIANDVRYARWNLKASQFIIHILQHQMINALADEKPPACLPIQIGSEPQSHNITRHNPFIQTLERIDESPRLKTNLYTGDNDGKTSRKVLQRMRPPSICETQVYPQAASSKNREL